MRWYKAGLRLVAGEAGSWTQASPRDSAFPSVLIVSLRHSLETTQLAHFEACRSVIYAVFKS